MAQNTDNARKRGNSLTTTPDRPAPNSGGSMATTHAEESQTEEESQSQEEHRSQESHDMTNEPQDYDLQPSGSAYPSSSSPTNPAPRNVNITSSSVKGGKKKPPERGYASRKPMVEPPITKNSLKELDVNQIVHNARLRHDINFDPNLAYRPNNLNRQTKVHRSNYFWHTLRTQLQEYLLRKDEFEKELDGAEWCLPVILKTIRGILETLVPHRDRSSVQETFNVELLMQQFSKGVADLERLASWLAQLLKSHCAPMRDAYVDDMVEQLSNGARNWDVELLVHGISSLLGVLESMKLDVANHQIRCLRPLLIEDTVHFEQKYFMKKIAAGRIDTVTAYAWFRRAVRFPDAATPSRRLGDNTWGFMKALVNLTLPPRSSEVVPHTFELDEQRLLDIRAVILDLVNLEVCMYLYRSIKSQMRQQRPRLTQAKDTPPTSLIPSPADEGILSAATLPCEQDFRRSISARSVATTREDMGDALSPSSCSSQSSRSATPETHPSTPLSLFAQDNEASTQVRSSLQAILKSSEASDRWATLAPSLALQLLRSTPAQLTRLSQFESQFDSHLAFHLSNPRSRLYQEAEAYILSKLLPVLQTVTESYTTLTTFQICEAATASKVAGTSNTLTDEKEAISSVATRIAHLGILHWRIWAELVYLVDFVV